MMEAAARGGFASRFVALIAGGTRADISARDGDVFFREHVDGRWPRLCSQDRKAEKIWLRPYSVEAPGDAGEAVH